MNESKNECFLLPHFPRLKKIYAWIAYVRTKGVLRKPENFSRVSSSKQATPSGRTKLNLCLLSFPPSTKTQKSGWSWADRNLGGRIFNFSFHFFGLPLVESPMRIFVQAFSLRSYAPKNSEEEKWAELLISFLACSTNIQLSLRFNQLLSVKRELPQFDRKC